MTTTSVITFRINPNAVIDIRSRKLSSHCINPNIYINKSYPLNRFTHHAMQVLTKVLELRHDLPIPRLVVFLNEVCLPLLVELFNQSTVLDILHHLKVGLTLNILIVPNPVEETLGAVLNLHEGPRTILILLNPVNPPNNLVQSPLNLTDVEGVVGIIPLQNGAVKVSSLILVTGSMIRV